ncbi:hypothetical protein PIB30_059706 [Stylosanthes scabra]|uniref:PB1 domain-containing protein n=1 Tax=Stylosanthes scabra TaxID=79078 RepID=A0ABU6VIU4_9FABA|nr:hypothetical protein [Stylosanthes scabra]
MEMEIQEARFVCSYGGINKVLYVDRRIDFTGMVAQICGRFGLACNGHNFKYQLPGGNSLVSVTNDSDLDDMMLVLDQLYRDSPRSSRIRLFLFPNPNDVKRTTGNNWNLWDRKIGLNFRGVIISLLPLIVSFLRILCKPGAPLARSREEPVAVAEEEGEESFKEQAMGFLMAWCEILMELGRGCRDILRQNLLNEVSFVFRNRAPPCAKVSKRLNFLNDFLPEDRDPFHAWSIVVFVLVLALAGSFLIPIPSRLSDEFVSENDLYHNNLIEK